MLGESSLLPLIASMCSSIFAYAWTIVVTSLLRTGLFNDAKDLSDFLISLGNVRFPVQDLNPPTDAVVARLQVVKSVIGDWFPTSWFVKKKGCGRGSNVQSLLHLRLV